MGRFVDFARSLAALVFCCGIAVIGVACGGEGTADPRGSRIEGTEPGDCQDDADNDADGLFDCSDPGCLGASICRTDGGAGGAGGAGGLSGMGGAGGTMLCVGVDCDDQNECTEDTCDPMDGTCGHTNVTEGTRVCRDLRACPGRAPVPTTQRWLMLYNQWVSYALGGFILTIFLAAAQLLLASYVSDDKVKLLAYLAAIMVSVGSLMWLLQGSVGFFSYRSLLRQAEAG